MPKGNGKKVVVVGAGLVVIAHRSGTVVDLAFADGSIFLLGIETLLWAVVVLAATTALFHFNESLEGKGITRTGTPVTSRPRRKKASRRPRRPMKCCPTARSVPLMTSSGMPASTRRWV